ncbi:MAG: hypothetical protein KI785_11905 [Devosiaceae bacterium]|nr:hypothetical protein [Devosiaceae bacterium MH13]
MSASTAMINPISPRSAGPDRLACAIVVGLLCVAVLVPKVAGMLVDILPGYHTVVICSGGEMIAITLSPDGEPVQHGEGKSEPCQLNHALVFDERPIPLWIALACSYAFEVACAPNLVPDPSVLVTRGASRAPPVVV